MSIITEQNILGNPELALAVRPAGEVTISDYSFATLSTLYEKNLHKAMSNSRGGSWTRPTSYIGELFQAEVTQQQPAGDIAGPGGEETVVVDRTQYGFSGGDMHVNENATQQSKLSQVAQVIAEEADPVGPGGGLVDLTASAARSESQMQNGPQGPEASGGAFNGFESTNPYYISTNAFQGAGATTEPNLIDYSKWQGDMAANDAEKESLGDDAPSSQTSVGAYSQGPSRKTGVGNYTQGQSAANIPSGIGAYPTSQGKTVFNATSVGSYTQGTSTKTGNIGTYTQGPSTGTGLPDE